MKNTQTAWLMALKMTTLGLVSGLTASASEPSKVFDIGALLSILESQAKPASVDQIIPLLPSAYKENVSYVYDSNSLQGANYLFPRVISYGSNYPYDRDRLTVAFKGNPTLPNKTGVVDDSLEAIDYNPKSHRFEYYSVHFEKKAGKNYWVEGPNPPLCMGCHTADYRPNWSRYPEWPGVYGSSDLHVKAAEKDGWIAFYQGNKNTGRYQELKLDPIDYQAQSRPEEAFRPSTLTNLRLDRKLDRQNRDRVVNLIQGTPDYDSYRFAIYAATKGCKNIETFLPDDLQSQFSNSFIELYNDTFMRTRQCCTQVASILKDYQITRIASLRYLFENRQINIDSWYTNFGANTFHESIENYYDEPYQLSQALERSFSTPGMVDADLQTFVPPSVDLNNKIATDFMVDCNQLKAESLQALSY